MSDYVDDRLDGIEFAPRGGVWRNKFREERKNVERKNKELTRLRAENSRLREALEPFARWANQMDSPPNWVPDGCPIIASPGDISDFCVGMLRRARAALAGEVKNG